MLVKKCGGELPDDIKFSEEGEKKAEEEAQNVFVKEYLYRANSGVYKPKEYVCLSSMCNFYCEVI